MKNADFSGVGDICHIDIFLLELCLGEQSGLGEIGMRIPMIDINLCDGCGLCVESCPEKALFLYLGKVRFRTELVGMCSYCGLCEAACKNHAIICPYKIRIN